MLNWLRTAYQNWLDRHERRQVAEFDAGFGWAMTQRYHYGWSVDAIERWVPLGQYDISAFDRGVLRAVSVIDDLDERINEIK